MNTEKRNRLIDSFITLVAEKGMAASGVDTIAKFAAKKHLRLKH
jgi:AcrR family transcriptional regulator